MSLTTDFLASVTVKWNKWTLNKSSFFTASTGHWRMLVSQWKRPVGPEQGSFLVNYKKKKNELILLPFLCQ